MALPTASTSIRDDMNTLTGWTQETTLDDVENCRGWGKNKDTEAKG